MERRTFLASGMLGLLAPWLRTAAASAAGGVFLEPPVSGGPTGGQPDPGLPLFGRPAVFYSPHADDETLSMGVDIGNHLRAGRDVVLVLVSLGTSAGVLDVINGRAYDGLLGTTHQPGAESYLGPLTGGVLDAGTLAASRSAEFSGAARALVATVGAGRLAISVVGRPEGFSATDVMPMMAQFENLYPGASHKTTSWTDAHPDHQACAAALARLADQRVVSDARYYVQPGRRALAAAAGVALGEVRPSAGVANAVRAASGAYRVWDPAAGRYAFGYHSVQTTFDAITADPVGWVHR